MMRTASILVLVVAAACGGSGHATQRVNYPDGTHHYEYQLQRGIPHGIGRVWHQNGELKSEGEYVNGVKHGRFKFFNGDGAFEYQAYFYKGAEVWRSTQLSANPPPELLQGLIAFSGSPPQLGTDEGRTAPPPVTEEWSVKLSRDPPAPYFSSLDRTTGLSRVGLQYGFGDASERQVGAVTRLELFLNYKFSRFGVYGQLQQSNFEATPNMSLSGRRTAEVGGTYHTPLAIGGLSLRAGVLAPIGNDDMDGFVAATAGSFHRPTDVAASFPSTVAIRTGSSLTRSHSRFVLQADGGVDWLLGGQSSFDALVRANGGVGLGIRSGLLSVELSNVLRVSDPTRHVHALGLGGTFWMEQLWITLFASSSFEGHIALTGSLGYEL
jgi:hypothetical protein